ncbi:MAG: FHA domain-containing protein [Tannerellaceae bacterium]|nr:FHA domain-containing protein [Tannerellaceae bacterium]
MATKLYTIGRDEDCFIRIQDNGQRVSRRHATLKITGNGKMFIADHSSNGTFVNGMRIASDVDFPVKRKDVVSFANEIELDWKLIPGRRKKLIIYSAAAVVLIAGVAVFLLWNNGCLHCAPDRELAPADSLNVKADSLKMEVASIGLEIL